MFFVGVGLRIDISEFNYMVFMLFCIYVFIVLGYDEIWVFKEEFIQSFC